MAESFNAFLCKSIQNILGYIEENVSERRRVFTKHSMDDIK